MFGQRSNQNALEPPPLARTQSDAIEILRVWAVTEGPQQVVLRTRWKDPAAWGIMLADLARHVAQAYAAEGRDSKVVLARIREGFDAEWDAPTDEPKNISGS